MIETAFVLAGGKGERLKELTKEKPKPLIEVKGKPILQYLVELLQRSGVKKIVFGVGYKAKQIIEFFGSGERFGMRFEFVEEKKPLGTGGALKLAAPLLGKRFYMFNGDNLFELNLKEMEALHKRTGALATIALVESLDLKDFGTVSVNGTLVREFHEKSAHPKSNLVNAGAYILEKKVTELIPDGFNAIEETAFQELVKRKQMHAFLMKGQWFPTDTMERLERARKEWKGWRQTNIY